MTMIGVIDDLCEQLYEQKDLRRVLASPMELQKDRAPTDGKAYWSKARTIALISEKKINLIEARIIRSGATLAEAAVILQ